MAGIFPYIWLVCTVNVGICMPTVGEYISPMDPSWAMVGFIEPFLNSLTFQLRSRQVMCNQVACKALGTLEKYGTRTCSPGQLTSHHLQRKI